MKFSLCASLALNVLYTTNAFTLVDTKIGSPGESYRGQELKCSAGGQCLLAALETDRDKARMSTFGSADSGKVWSVPPLVDGKADESRQPSVSCVEEAGKVKPTCFLVWPNKDKVIAAVTADLGETWLEVRELSIGRREDVESADVSCTTVAPAGIRCVTLVDSNLEILAFESSDAGKTWSGPKTVVDKRETSTAGRKARISCQSTTCYLAYSGREFTKKAPEKDEFLYVAKSTDGGSTFTNLQKLPWSAQMQAGRGDGAINQVRLSCVSATSCVVVTENAKDGSSWIEATSTKDGTTWTAQTTLFPGEPGIAPSISCITSGTCVLAWLKQGELRYSTSATFSFTTQQPITVPATPGPPSVSCTTASCVLVFTVDGELKASTLTLQATPPPVPTPGPPPTMSPTALGETRAPVVAPPPPPPGVNNPSPPDASTEDQDDSPSSATALAAGIGGGTSALLLGMGAAVLVRRRRSQSRLDDPLPPPPPLSGKEKKKKKKKKSKAEEDFDDIEVGKKKDKKEKKEKKEKKKKTEKKNKSQVSPGSVHSDSSVSSGNPLFEVRTQVPSVDLRGSSRGRPESVMGQGDTGRTAFAGAFANVVESCVMHPLDSIKTRQQLRGQSIWEAWKGLGSIRVAYRGLLPAVAMQAPRGMVKFVTNSTVSNSLGDSIWAACSGGFIAGASESFLITPFEFAKVRLQRSGHGYRNAFQLVSTVLRKDGLLTLWVGLEATMVRNGAWNAVYFGTIHGLREVDNMPALVKGTLAGALGSCLSNPIDVCKSRIQAEEKSSGGFQLVRMIRSVYEKEGLLGLYRGFPAKVARLGPGGGILLVAFQQGSHLCRTVYQLYVASLDSGW